MRCHFCLAIPFLLNQPPIRLLNYRGFRHRLVEAFTTVFLILTRQRWSSLIKYSRHSEVRISTGCAYKILCKIILHFDIFVSMGGPIALLFISVLKHWDLATISLQRPLFFFNFTTITRRLPIFFLLIFSLLRYQNLRGRYMIWGKEGNKNAGRDD